MKDPVLVTISNWDAKEYFLALQQAIKDRQAVRAESECTKTLEKLMSELQWATCE